VLYVVAGGIAMYELIVELSITEEIEFKLRGHLDSLAREISKNEKNYSSRLLLPKTPDEKIEFVSAI
jgi:hypothetical protein